VSREAPDYVLVDFNMPGKDGLTLAAELREMNPQIEVALISANHQVEVVDRAHATGATFIRKPLTEQSLASFLDEATGRDISSR
jgi:YesN/AraC family two-component response regulator